MVISLQDRKERWCVWCLVFGSMRTMLPLLPLFAVLAVLSPRLSPALPRRLSLPVSRSPSCSRCLALAPLASCALLVMLCPSLGAGGGGEGW